MFFHPPLFLPRKNILTHLSASQGRLPAEIPDCLLESNKKHVKDL